MLRHSSTFDVDLWSIKMFGPGWVQARYGERRQPRSTSLVSNRCSPGLLLRRRFSCVHCSNLRADSLGELRGVVVVSCRTGRPSSSECIMSGGA